jgi:hypothetical protein
MIFTLAEVFALHYEDPANPGKDLQWFAFALQQRHHQHPLPGVARCDGAEVQRMLRAGS